MKAWAAVAAMTCLWGSAGHAMPLLEASSARAAFRIDLPEGCVLQDGSLQAGYATFHVSCGGRIYAGIYAGNAPDPTVPRSRLIETEDKWPKHVQVWSEVVPGDQSRADAIAASVKVRRMKVALG
ncbi:MAG: hypothetical protein U1C74_10565 [Phenylobacterium sp.]|nr:hypothetical protein [Phenylobacterium sp.]